MTDILLIGEIIATSLESDNSITSKVGRRIFPIVAPDETKFPFIVYTRANAYSSIYSKDGFLGDKASFQISIASDKYTESVQIANDVRKNLENKYISSGDLKIDEIRLVSSAESFSDDTYIQTLYFDCEAE